MKHPHAELMKQYAEDAMETDKPWERWEVSYGIDKWRKLDEVNMIWYKHMQYRRKPEPEEDLPSIGTPVWVRDSLDHAWTIGMFAGKAKGGVCYIYGIQYDTRSDSEDTSYYKYMTTENPYKPAV